MRQIRKSFLTATFFLAALIISGCSTSTKSIVSTEKSFSNFLVIGVAQDYESRSQFERMLARDISKTGVAASAFYSVVGGNKPIDKETIEGLVQSHGYDAVLIARVTDRKADSKAKTVQGQTRVDRMDDGPLHLFRYDYTELNEPITLEFGIDVGLVTEVYDVASGERVWAIDSELDNREIIYEVVEDAVNVILRRLKRDDLIPG